MKTLPIAGLLVVFAFALSGFAIADEAKSAPKNIPGLRVGLIRPFGLTGWVGF
jgi:hypothetical protein